MNDKITITMGQFVFCIILFCLCMYMVIGTTAYFCYLKAEKGLYIENVISHDIEAFRPGFNKIPEKKIKK